MMELNLLTEENRTLKETFQEKVKVGSFRKMSDKIPLLFQNNKKLVSQAPKTKAELKTKVCSPITLFLRETHFHLLFFIKYFLHRVILLRDKKTT